jgi:hypothetical protein
MRDARAVRGLIVGFGLFFTCAVAGCGDQSDQDAVSVKSSYEGQPVTVSTLEDGSEARRWVTLEGYRSAEAEQRDQLLREVWRQFSEDHGSSAAEDTPDPRNLDRSEADACRVGPNGGDYVFWYRESNAGTPQIYAERCPDDL